LAIGVGTLVAVGVVVGVAVGAVVGVGDGTGTPRPRSAVTSSVIAEADSSPQMQGASAARAV